MAAEVTVNLFLKTKGGYKGHVQAKLTDDEASAQNAFATLAELESHAGLAGATTDAFQASTGGSTGTHSTGESKGGFGAKSDPGDGQCPNGCGPRPWVKGTDENGGKLSKNNKPYKSFWGECRTCGYKNSR